MNKQGVTISMCIGCVSAQLRNQRIGAHSASHLIRLFRKVNDGDDSTAYFLFVYDIFRMPMRKTYSIFMACHISTGFYMDGW